MADTSEEMGGGKRTVAPTNAATLEKANAHKKVNPVHMDFITLVHQHFMTTGKLMGPVEAHEQYLLTEEQYWELANNEFITAAIQERGIEWPPTKETFNPLDPPADLTAELTLKHFALKPEQFMIANMMLDMNDTRSVKKKLQDNGVSLRTYQTWLRDPKFSEYLRTTAERMLGNHEHEAAMAFMDRISSGDMGAIKFYYEMTGKYTPSSSSSAGSTAAVQDVQNVLVSVVEIILEEVTDKATALRIAERIKTLTTARQVAGALVGAGEGAIDSNPVGNHNRLATPTLPPTAKPREMTPELQKLMNLSHGGPQ